MNAFASLVERQKSSGKRLLAMSASGQLGYGIPVPAFKAGIARNPDFIGCDMGSVDPGPYYLGAGQMATDREITKQDLRLVVVGARHLNVPLLIGTAGTAGAAPHVDATLDLVREIAAEEGLHFKLASIYADIPGKLVEQAKAAGRLHPLGNIPTPTDGEIGSSRIVAQMGMEAFERALNGGADVIVAGRACDTAIYATIPHLLGYSLASSMHMAKIIECASICCTPGGRDAILGHLDPGGFVIESLNPDRHATPLSVAAHSLYEQAEPYSVAEPRGALHIEDAVYEAIDGHRTRVSGARFESAGQLRVKIEGVIREGSRGVLIAASADPGFISGIEEIIRNVELTVRTVVAKPFRIFPRIYGRGSVSLWQKPTRSNSAEEIFILIECVAETDGVTRAVLTSFKQYLLHHGFSGRLCTGGNLAFPITPPELMAGEAYRFSLYHLMQIDREANIFPVKFETL